MATPGPPKIAAPVACLPPGMMMARAPLHQAPMPAHTAASMELQRAHMLQDLRIRYSLAALQQQQQQHPHAHFPPGIPQHPGASMFHPGHNPHQLPPSPHGFPDPRMHAAFFFSKDPRARFFHEEPKPSYSYIGLISMALLSSKEKKLILGDIYQWILDNYPYFRQRGPGWRNSIRHNLSLNDCFIKSGRAANGKGHYWAIHPANIEDFKRGDFRRRRAQRKVRRSMGLDVPDEEDSPSPPPGTVTALDWRARMIQDPAHRPRYPSLPPGDNNMSPPLHPLPSPSKTTPVHHKRGFDVASLLAPDCVTSIDACNGGDREGVVEPESPRDNIDEEDEEWIDVDSTGETQTDDNEKDPRGVKRKFENCDGNDNDNEEQNGVTDSFDSNSSPPPLKLKPLHCDTTLEQNKLNTTNNTDNSDTDHDVNRGNVLPTSFPPASWPPGGAVPPFWRPGSFPFPPPFFPWPASLPSSFTAALYANALSRSMPQPAPSQNGDGASTQYTADTTESPDTTLDESTAKSEHEGQDSDDHST